MNDFIVIAHPLGALKPEIVLRTQNEELARAEAHRMLRSSQRDVQVFDLYDFQLVLALCHEPADPA